MLDKDQALAAMDAHIIRAEAERKVRLERRTRRFTWLYPTLRNAPPEEREALVHSASKHVLRRWPIYALAALATFGIGAAIFLPDSTAGSTIVLAAAALVFALEIFFAVIYYARMRSFIGREVTARFQNGTEKGCAPGVYRRFR